MSATSTLAYRAWRRFGGSVFRFVRSALAVVGLAFILFHMCFSLSVVVSGSMAPTLKGDGDAGSDWVVSEKVSYWFRQPRRWEVVQFRNSEGFVVAKRVAGLPGELISLDDKKVVIDNEVIPFPNSLEFLRYYSFAKLNRGRQDSCEKGYYVLGDDSHDSADSRYDGPIAPERIQSRAWLIVWPPSRMGFINP